MAKCHNTVEQELLKLFPNVSIMLQSLKNGNVRINDEIIDISHLPKTYNGERITFGKVW